MDRKLIGELVIAALVIVGFHQFAEHSGAIMGVFSNEVFALFLVTAAVALFAIRKFMKASFGLVELAVGVDALWNVPDTAPLVIDGITRTQFLLQIAAGLYLIIRGLDNIDQSGFLGRWRKARI
jgi:hypothetical protein